MLWHKGSPLGVSDSSDSKLPTPRRMFWWVILLDQSDPGILHLASFILPAPSRAEWGVWGPARLHHLRTMGPGLPDSQSCILPRAPDRLAFTQQRWKMTDHRPAPPATLPTEATPSQSPGSHRRAPSPASESQPSRQTRRRWACAGRDPNRLLRRKCLDGRGSLEERMGEPLPCAGFLKNGWMSSGFQHRTVGLKICQYTFGACVSLRSPRSLGEVRTDRG